MEYQLSVNRKSLEGGTSPDRNIQFGFINKQAKKFLKNGWPVISVDCKKKESIGNYRQNGRIWRPKGDPELVKVYDFIDKKLGTVSPYGIYDLDKTSAASMSALITTPPSSPSNPFAGGTTNWDANFIPRRSNFSSRRTAAKATEVGTNFGKSAFRNFRTTPA
jgi:hypothetical protein